VEDPKPNPVEPPPNEKPLLPLAELPNENPLLPLAELPNENPPLPEENELKPPLLEAPKFGPQPCC
jgi:hypothetical protein